MELDLGDLAQLATDIDELLKKSDRNQDITEQLAAIYKQVEHLALELGILKAFEAKYQAHLKETGFTQILVPLPPETPCS